MSRGLAAITGASAGLGVEFASQLAAAGYDLLLIARREDRLQQLCDRLKTVHKISCDTLTADLADGEQLARVEARLHDANDLVLLVNNAGFGTLGLFADAPLEDQDRMHRVHVLAAMRLSHAVLSGMIARRRGGIINVSSIAGFVVTAGSTSYCATKAWMNRFTEGLHLELRGSGSPVKVQALCPGYTRTEFHQTLHMDASRIPGWMWLAASRVVRDSLTGLREGKLFVIPSRRYRSMLRAYKLLPLAARHRLGMAGSRLRKPSAN